MTQTATHTPEEQLRIIRELIPMDYLEGRDTVSALREYSAARWRIIDRCKRAETDRSGLLDAATDLLAQHDNPMRDGNSAERWEALRAAIAKAEGR